MPALILASHSPRRKEALKRLNIRFIAVGNSVEEEKEIMDMNASPESVAVHLSLLKAESVSDQYPDDYVLGLDTIVVLNEQIIGKPRDESDAFRILASLSGEWHEVITGITLNCRECKFRETRAVHTRVKFRKLTNEQIRDYIATGEPLDKAGAYGIQSEGARLVEKIEGDFSNVVGFPEQEVMDMLLKAGIFNQTKDDRKQKAAGRDHSQI